MNRQLACLLVLAWVALQPALAVEVPIVEKVPPAKIAIVGGTFINDALLNSPLLKSQFKVSTAAGESPRIYYGTVNEVPFYYVHMHGEDRVIQTWLALSQLGVREVIGGATAGGVNVAMKIFDCVIPHDFIDLNVDRARMVPMEDLPNKPSGIPRFVPPMDPILRKILIEETRVAVRARADLADINVLEKGVVIQAAGGRFETVAEVAFFKQVGSDLVTLNVGTEIAYARQLGMNYACLCVISNPAEGIGDWKWDDIREVYPRMNPLCVEILIRCIPKIAKIPEGERVGDKLRFHPEFTAKPQPKKGD